MSKQLRKYLVTAAVLVIAIVLSLVVYLSLKSDEQSNSKTNTTSAESKKQDEFVLTGTLGLTYQKGQPTGASGEAQLSALIKVDGKQYILWSDPEVPTLTKALGMTDPTVKLTGKFEDRPQLVNREYEMRIDDMFRVTSAEILDPKP